MATKEEYSILILLDLTAALATIDHALSLDRLHNWLGLSDTALNWFECGWTLDI